MASRSTGILMLRALVYWLGWLLLAIALAALAWALVQWWLPVTNDGKTSRTALIWPQQLDRYWVQESTGPVMPLETPVVRSQLSVKVQGILLSDTAGQSVVLLQYRNRERTLGVGDELESGIRLLAIHADHLIFERHGQPEQVALQIASSVVSRPSGQLLDQGHLEVSSARRQSMAVNSQEATDVERIGSRVLEEVFGPEFRNSLLSDPLQLMRHIVLVPERQGGQLRGYRLNPGSEPQLFEQVGLRAGDRLVAVNGKPVTDTAAMMALLQELRTAMAVEVQVERDGRPLRFSLEME